MSTSNSNSYCCICLTHHWITDLSFIEPQKSLSVLSQLQKIVPEVVWNADFKICMQCIELVDKFAEFKKLCVESSLKQKSIKSEGSITDDDKQVDKIDPPEVLIKEEQALEDKSSLNSKLDNNDDVSDYEAGSSEQLEVEDSDYEPPKKVAKRKREKILSNICSSCGKTFSKKTELKKHEKKTCSAVKLKKKKLEAEKKLQGRIHCSFNCPQVFTDPDEYEEHQKTCEGLFSINRRRVPYIDESIHACQKCSRRFTSELVLTTHVNECIGTSGGDISEVKCTCPLCKREFSTKNSLNAHFTKLHRDLDMQNMCQVCLTVFSTAQELTAHVHTPEEVATATQSPQQQQQQCDTCHDVFDSILELGKHCFTAHDTVWVSDATCEVCLEVFPSDADAVNHYKDAHGIDEATLIRPFFCWHCPARFSHATFKSHIKYNYQRKLVTKKINLKKRAKLVTKRSGKIKDAVDARYRCDDCLKMCLCKSELEAHCAKEHKEKYNGTVHLACRHCAGKASSASALYAHVRARHMPAVELNADKPCLSCEACDATFTTVESVTEHCKTQHNLEGSTVTPYACPHCQFRCVTLATFNTHIATYFEEKQRFVCPTCGAEFSTKQAEQAHEDSVHKKITHMCEACGRIFPKKGNLRAHIKCRHPELVPVEQLLKCSIGHCDKNFVSKADLQIHLDRVNGVKNYACHACPMTFRRKAELNAHIKRTHSGERELFKCEECHQEFKDKYYLKVHMKKEHNIGTVKWIPRCQQPRKHACHLCPKDYRDKKELQRHLDSHAGIKRYACQFCNSAYVKRENLKSHLLKHHNFLLSASTSFK